MSQACWNFTELILYLGCFPFNYVRTMLTRCCVRVRPRNRKTKRVAFWVVTVALCMLVMTFNDMTLRVMQSSFDNGYVSDKDYAVKSVNARYPKAIIKEEEEEEVPDLDIPQENDPGNDLLPDLAPSTLHYLWCGYRHYEFKHYLALKSAVRVIRPDKVFFHYEILPRVDDEEYYQWFNQSVNEISHMTLRRINNTACHRKGSGRYILIMSLLHELGGIYIPEDAILVDFPTQMRSQHLVTGAYAQTETDFLEGIMVGKRLSFTKPETPEQLQMVMAQGRENHGGMRPCDSEKIYNRDRKGEVICVNINRELFPKDIWNSKGRFNILARVIMYGSRIVKPIRDSKSHIPLVAHYISLEDPFITFTGYLSMLSSIYVAGFQKVFIHGPLTPRGVWWQRLSSDNRFVYVPREFPESEAGTEMPVHLATCVMRSDILLKYGGVYNDYNVLWTQPIPEELLKYEAVASPDWHLHGNWPESVNHGTLMAKRGSRYIRYLKQMFNKFSDRDYWFVDHYLSYRVLELHPELMFLYPHLQVKCLNHNCHPTWQGDYRSRVIQNKPGRPFSWSNQTLSLHWVDNFPELDPDMVKYTSGVVIDVSRAILKQAGIPIIKL